MGELANQSILFGVEGLPFNTLVATRLVGREELSRPWRFELELVSREPNLDLEQVLYAPVQLGLCQFTSVGGERARRTYWYCGVLESFDQLEQGQGWTRYAAVMVPRLSLLDEHYRSRVFMDCTLEELTHEVFGAAGFEREDDYRLQLERAQDEPSPERKVYPRREYTAQYEESDLAFLSRWLEQEGAWYCFLNSEQQERVLIADSQGAYRPASARGLILPYRPQGAAGRQTSLLMGEYVKTFACSARRRRKGVELRDYNWRTPEVELHAQSEVEARGFGVQAEYNDHFKTPEQGDALAGVRREELSCQARRFVASSTCKALRPGTTFSLEKHYRGGFNQDYLVEAVVHTAEQAVDFDAAQVSTCTYGNELVLLPADVEYRPARRTPWPQIHGVIHAKVDAPETDGEFAELDDYGRYRLRFPFDTTRLGDRKHGHLRSRYVRMLQPYAGRKSGMHFPLLKGTDVMVVHLDGDPDRPVIAGAVPNTDTLSPVTAGNHTSNRIETTSGNLLEFSDDPDRPGVYSHDAARSFVQDQRFRVQGGFQRSGAGSPAGGSGGVGATGARPSAEGARTGRAASAPGDGAGSSAAAAVTPAPTPWEEFVNGAAFAQLRDSGVEINGHTLSGDELRDALEVLIRRHPDFGGGSFSTTPSSMADLHANLNKEIGEVIAWPIGGGKPSDGSLDGFLADIEADGGEQYYTAQPRAVWTRIGDYLSVAAGKHTFDYTDVRLAVSAKRGGATYERVDGDTFAESYRNGIERSVEFAYGNKESFSFRMAGESEHSVALGARVATTSRLAADTENTFLVGVRNENSVWLGAVLETSIFVGGNITLNLSPIPTLEINIAPEAVEVQIPKSTALSIDDITVKLNGIDTSLSTMSNTITSMENSISDQANKISDNENKISQTDNKLTETANKLTETETKLAETQTKLSETETKLSQSTTALSQESKTLTRTVTSAIHSIA
ncbi:MAG: type VI secretion system tip protein TssI/VgrG [Planctomycetota bacterium]